MKKIYKSLLLIIGGLFLIGITVLLLFKFNVFKTDDEVGELDTLAAKKVALNFYRNYGNYSKPFLTIRIKKGKNVKFTSKQRKTIGEAIDREEYNFIGWYTEKEGGTEIDLSLAINEDLNLYAHWKKREESDNIKLDMQINPETLSLKVKGSYTLKVENTTDKVTWKSENKKIAKVNSKGKVTGVSEGETTIVATSKTDKNKKALCKVTVSNTQTTNTTSTITLNKTSTTINVGKTEKLKATIEPKSDSKTKITWASSNKKIATVDNNGKIKGIKAGKVTITASIKNGPIASCEVTVQNVITVSSITLNKTNITMYVGAGDETLVPNIKPSEASNTSLTWKSSNSKVVKVDNNGKLMALKSGTATITVKTANKKTATCKVTVKYDITRDLTIEQNLKKYPNISNVKLVDSCYSDTLRYNIYKYEDEIYSCTPKWQVNNDKKYRLVSCKPAVKTDTKEEFIVFVWAADPARQLNSALPSGKYMDSAKADSILRDEKSLFYPGKKGCMVAVNASFFNMINSTTGEGTQEVPVVINKGRVLKNGSLSNNGKLLTIKQNGVLELSHYSNGDAFKENKVLNTWNPRVSREIKSGTKIEDVNKWKEVGGPYTYKLGGTTVDGRCYGKPGDNRCKQITMVAQFPSEKNNFVLFSGYGYHIYTMGKIMTITSTSNNTRRTGTIYNLDGSDSRNLFYQKKNGEMKQLVPNNRMIVDMLYFSEDIPTSTTTNHNIISDFYNN